MFRVLTPCANCVDAHSCTVAEVLSGAAFSINEIAVEKNFPGAGRIILECDNQKKKEAKENA